MNIIKPGILNSTYMMSVAVLAAPIYLVLLPAPLSSELQAGGKKSGLTLYLISLVLNPSIWQMA